MKFYEQHKKLLLVVGILTTVALSSSGYAIWNYYFRSSTALNVISTQPNASTNGFTGFTYNFSSPQNVDVTNSGAATLDVVTLTGNDGKSFLAYWNTVQTATNPLCQNITGDVNTSFTKAGIDNPPLIANNTVFTVVGSPARYQIYWQIVQSACPQIVQTTLNLVPQ
jgi:hypothetical protein